MEFAVIFVGGLITWLLFGIGTALIASSKGGNGCLWFGLGMLLGPFGLLFAVLSGRLRRIGTFLKIFHQCPYCKSPIHKEAIRCPKCQVDLARGGSATELS